MVVRYGSFSCNSISGKDCGCNALSGICAKLSNPGFLAKAPKEKVAVEQEKLEGNKTKLAEIEKRLAELN